MGKLRKLTIYCLTRGADSNVDDLGKVRILTFDCLFIMSMGKYANVYKKCIMIVISVSFY